MTLNILKRLAMDPHPKDANSGPMLLAEMTVLN